MCSVLCRQNLGGTVVAASQTLMLFVLFAGPFQYNTTSPFRGTSVPGRFCALLW